MTEYRLPLPVLPTVLDGWMGRQAIGVGDEEKRQCERSEGQGGKGRACSPLSPLPLAPFTLPLLLVPHAPRLSENSIFTNNNHHFVD